VIALRARNSGILLLVFLAVATVAIVGNLSPVQAASCTATLSSLVTGDYFNYHNIALIIPVSAQCSFSNAPLYANGLAYEMPGHTSLGNATAVMVSGPGSGQYYAQLVFTLPMSDQGHEVEVTVFNSQTQMGIVTTSEAGGLDPTTEYVNQAGCMNDNACNSAYNACYSANFDNNLQCVGYITQNQNSCVELAIPDYSPYGMLDYRYYTLQNLPASYPAVGTWATVTGTLHIGTNTAPNGAA
jgi:hypothetical protein